MKLSEKKRIALIEAAQQEFIEHGFSGANMDRVCERAGTSKRTLYRHFESKDVLFIESIQAVMEIQRARLQFQYSPEKCIEAQLRTYLLAKIDSMYEDFGLPLAKMVISEFMRTPEFVENYLHQLQSQDEQLEKWFSEAIKDQKVKNLNPAMMSDMLMCLLKGNFLWPQLIANHKVPNLEQRKKSIEDILTLFLDGYRC
ncbi:TPA: TetR/AcrR family transcriptional regulator [Vibrio parahaemolyticus]|uniref:TetR/AcrR family transcriptional regulator n=1 Tax=Vibrio parahaemolyticus TaxID=670 RepID=UPI00079FD6B5|nr:TetR/AcrR family transcriptional regulator [Vibrio parahaemolyticus]EGQ8524464.1 TetR family transcriptional regulator [Vibrio parahaemolyticus]EGQ9164066.1 TetR/AcrR family transcriptional regulator [Vibrio parahaemolyticus]EGQ9208461.1 TetR/AcrR family transcriptional regulator [Vibrio parahaemolyticus]EGQ9785314.1 TetR/AcrR family transcriptional regulator [Vibrio parahaemolyticus]EGQ9923175.1 TetR/AcrR family transcriptional regulator [Vibrio parahaemolyticus]